ncbi:hypothetical protein CAPTEDRAFT_205368 [Capitella teleta]|uniref:LRRCT domain-containing protein n=1 Tax=Capitella teleta TaxID=283909 RepID=R7TTT4_CAPTE|nr:hypothetical protein CAPTEDRAFT_205368 [Capitella teleta]|eukprot:ELT94866.1 hypothetical protein CAPTEDRAFT_205368 [Capitella teleta]
MLCLWIALCCGSVPSTLSEELADFTNQSLLEVPKNISAETTHLDLGYTNIQILRKDGLAHLPNLQHLFVQHTPLRIIEKHAFKGTQLTRIVFSSNQLKVFPYLLDISETLKTFRLIKNGLRVIKEEHLLGLNKLEKLYLSDNHIYRIPDIKTLLPSLVHFDFASMQIECCDKLLPLKAFTNETLDVTKRPCSYPPELKPEIWWSIATDAVNKPCPESRRTLNLCAKHFIER